MDRSFAGTIEVDDQIKLTVNGDMVSSARAICGGCAFLSIYGNMSGTLQAGVEAFVGVGGDFAAHVQASEVYELSVGGDFQSGGSVTGSVHSLLVEGDFSGHLNGNVATAVVNGSMSGTVSSITDLRVCDLGSTTFQGSVGIIAETLSGSVYCDGSYMHARIDTILPGSSLVYNDTTTSPMTSSIRCQDMGGYVRLGYDGSAEILGTLGETGYLSAPCFFGVKVQTLEGSVHADLVTIEVEGWEDPWPANGTMWAASGSGMGDVYPGPEGWEEYDLNTDPQFTIEGPYGNYLNLRLADTPDATEGLIPTFLPVGATVPLEVGYTYSSYPVSGEVRLTFDEDCISITNLAGGTVTSGAAVSVGTPLNVQAIGVGDGSIYAGSVYAEGDHLFGSDYIDIRPFKPDLAIVKPGPTYQGEVPEDEEETVGVVATVNVDDDDNDGGSGAHGQTVIISDKDDTDGVRNENDLITIRLAGAEPNLNGWDSCFAAYYVLNFPTDHIRIWRNANKTGDVISGVTPFNASSNTYLYVEGISPSTPGLGEIIEAQCITDKVVGDDKGKVAVAEPMFAIFAIGPEPPEVAKASFEKFLAENPHRRAGDDRTDPYFIDGEGGHHYSIYAWDTEKGCKIALQTQDAYVGIDGHSNFGLGYAFGDDNSIRFIEDFMNVGEALTGVDLWKMRGYENLTIDSSEYADDSSTTWEPYDAWKDEAHTIMGAYGGPHAINVLRFYEEQPPNGRGKEYLFLQRQVFTRVDMEGQIRFAGVRPYHFERKVAMYRDAPGGMGKMETTETLYLLAVHTGWVAPKPPDLPYPDGLKYKMLLLNSCSSGRYFYDQFKHGTLIFTNDYIYEFADTAFNKYFDEIFCGTSDPQVITRSLNSTVPTDYMLTTYKDPYDYWTFTP